MSMKKTILATLVGVAAIFTLTGCIIVPAGMESTPAATPVESPVESPEETQEPVESPEPVVTTEDEYIAFVRGNMPGHQAYTDAELLQMAEDSCTIARGVGFEEGIDLLAEEATRLGFTYEEAEQLGFLYGAGVSYFCPEYL